MYSLIPGCFTISFLFKSSFIIRGMYLGSWSISVYKLWKVEMILCEQVFKFFNFESQKSGFNFHSRIRTNFQNIPIILTARCLFWLMNNDSYSRGQYGYIQLIELEQYLEWSPRSQKQHADISSQIGAINWQDMTNWPCQQTWGRGEISGSRDIFPGHVTSRHPGRASRVKIEISLHIAPQLTVSKRVVKRQIGPNCRWAGHH